MIDIVLRIKGVEKKKIKQLKFSIDEILIDKKTEVVECKSFNGDVEFVIIISNATIGYYILDKISNVLSNWMDSMRVKEVKVGDIEISGYSAKDVVKILSQIQNSSDD